MNRITTIAIVILVLSLEVAFVVKIALECDEKMRRNVEKYGIRAPTCINGVIYHCAMGVCSALLNRDSKIIPCDKDEPE